MTAKNVITNCTKFNQCYFVKAILNLLEEYKEADLRMSRLDVTRWGDYNRGAHYARIRACGNTVEDLADLIATIDPTLLSIQVGEKAA